MEVPIVNSDQDPFLFIWIPRSKLKLYRSELLSSDL